MTTVEYSGVIDSSAQAVWKVLREFGGIAQWHPAIRQSKIEDGQMDTVVGAVRRLDLAEGGVIRERLLSLDDSRRALAYEFEESPLPLDNYRARVKVIEVSGASECAVEWSASCDVRDVEKVAHFESLITELIVGGHNSLALFLAQSETLDTEVSEAKG